MARELGGSQISALLESVPGIVNVLRSPVADALVGMIRAGAGLETFRLDAAQELVQYAMRRGLISASEGEQLLQEVTAVAPRSRKRASSTRGRAQAAAKPGKKPPARKAAPKSARKGARKQPSAKKAVKKTKKRVKRR